MRTVLDASAAVDLVARIGATDLVRHQLRHDDLLVPAHFDAEVLNALRRLHLGGVIDQDRRDIAIRALQRLPATRIPLPPLLSTATTLLGAVSGHEALYIACVIDAGADRLLTADRLLAGAPGTGIAITVV